MTRLIEETPEEKRSAQEAWEREIREARERQDADRDAGLPALARLFKIANGNSGQCRHVAAFLLGLYNGQRFPFDLTACRAVDAEIFDDMLLVLRMDSRPRAEVHTYFPNGSEAFEALADNWNLHKSGWEAASSEFVRRFGSYNCVIKPNQKDGSGFWHWQIFTLDRPPRLVVEDRDYTAELAVQSIREWFEHGGETPHDDE